MPKITRAGGADEPEEVEIVDVDTDATEPVEDLAVVEVPVELDDDDDVEAVDTDD